MTTRADGWYRIDGDCPAELGPGTINVADHTARFPRG